MRRIPGGGDDGGTVSDLFGGMVRWVTEEDEVGHDTSKRKILFLFLLYSLMLSLTFAASTGLWWYGYEVAAASFLLVGVLLFGAFGTMSVGWEILEFVDERRSPESGERLAEPPDRELAPNLSLSQDAKISFLVTVILLLLMIAGIEILKALF